MSRTPGSNRRIAGYRRCLYNQPLTNGTNGRCSVYATAMENAEVLNCKGNFLQVTSVVPVFIFITIEKVTF